MPITEPGSEWLPVRENLASWTSRWLTWFNEVWRNGFGWKRTYTASLTHDFGSINAQSQATQTVTVTGARSGDAVLVRPTTAVNGIILDGTVTASDTVTVRAVNYSSGSIDPDSQTYRVIVFQQ